MNGKYRRSGGKRYWRACPSCKVFVPVIPTPPPPPPPPTPQLLEGDLVIELDFSTVTLPVQLGGGQQIGVFWNWDGMNTQSLGTGITYTTGPVTSPNLSGPHPVVIRCTDWTCWKAAGITGNLQGKLLRILQWGNFESSEVDLFRECDTLTTTGEGVGVLVPPPSNPILAGAPTFSATCAGCFAGCSALTTLTNAAAWTFVNVTDTSEMFRACGAFDHDLASWNLSDAVDMSRMFDDCAIFNQDMTSWGSNTGNVTDMSSMFSGCAAFNNGGVPGGFKQWDVSGVKTTNSMFKACLVFNNGVAPGATGEEMFTLSVPPLVPPGAQAGFAAITDVAHMFENCSGFNSSLGPYNMAQWNLSLVKDTSYMLKGCSTFNNQFEPGDPGIAATFNWAPASLVGNDNLTDVTSMFEGCSVFNGIPFVLNTQTKNVKSMKRLFQGCSAFNNGDAIPLHFDTNNCTDMSEMFESASNFNITLSNNMTSGPPYGPWNTLQVVDCSGMFARAGAFNQDIGSWFDGTNGGARSALKNTTRMFHDAGNFNNGGMPVGVNTGAPLKWDVGEVTSMREMFDVNRQFAQYLYHSDGANDPWQVQKVRDMTGMFKDADHFNMNINDWNTSSVTTMEEMFKLAIRFNNGDEPLVLSNTQNVTSMKEMFCGAKAFNQEINFQSMQAVVNMIDFFKVCGAVAQPDMLLTQANYNAFLANIEAQILTLQTGVSFTGVTGNGAGIDPTSSPSYGPLIAAPYNWTIN